MSKGLTVAELRARLADLPDDLPVYYGYWPGQLVRSVEVLDELGDPDEPGPVVVIAT